MLLGWLGPFPAHAHALRRLAACTSVPVFSLRAANPRAAGGPPPWREREAGFLGVFVFVRLDTLFDFFNLILVHLGIIFIPPQRNNEINVSLNAYVFGTR